MIEIILALLLGVTFVAWPFLKAWAFQMKQLAEMQEDMDAFYRKWRHERPHLDIAVPFLPKQTYVFDYELVRKIYGNTTQLPYEMIKREMDYHAFSMPKAVMTDHAMMKSLTQVKRRFHKEMSSSGLAEIMPRFNSFAGQEIADLKCQIGMTRTVDIQDMLYTAMVRIALKTFWGRSFPLDGLSQELRSFDAYFGGICLAGQLQQPLRVLMQKGPCRPGFAAWAALVDRAAEHRKLDGLRDATSMVKKMDKILIELGWNEREAAVGSASMMFALTTNASDAVGLIFSHVIQSPRLLGKITEEIQTLPRSQINPNEPDLSYDVLMEGLPHLKSAVYETLRLRTSVISARIAKEDCTVTSAEHSVRIKKGRMVLLPIRALHTDDRVWKDPYVFDGARFVGNENKLKDLYHFGAGTSRCSGRLFAVAEMLSVLVHVLNVFDFDVSAAYVLRNHATVEGETFDIEDLGYKCKGFWPGRSKVWRANNAGVMRSDVDSQSALSI